MKLCGRCKQAIDVWGIPFIYVVKHNEVSFGEIAEEKIELCVSCQRQLRRWLNGEEVLDIGNVLFTDDLHD